MSYGKPLGPLFAPRLPARSADPDTSVQAAVTLRDSGKLGEHASTALATLKQRGPATARELAAGDFLAYDQLHKRLPELVKAGFARKVGRKVCSVTGKNATVWEAQ